MILNTLIVFALTMSPQTSDSNTYKYKANVSYQQNSTSLVQKSNQGDYYFIDSLLTFNCDVVYDDETSYRAYNFDFLVQSRYYKLTSTAGSATLDAQTQLEVVTDWEITPSSYLQHFDFIKFKVWVDDSDDNLFITYYYDNVEAQSNHIAISGSYDEVPTAQNIITFDGVSFFNSLEAALSNTYIEQEIITIVQPSEVSTASIIFQGICNIGLMPVNFFLGVLNFEVFGINIGAFVSALLTLAIVIIIVRIIFAGGNGKGKE